MSVSCLLTLVSGQALAGCTGGTSPAALVGHLQLWARRQWVAMSETVLGCYVSIPGPLALELQRTPPPQPGSMPGQMIHIEQLLPEHSGRVSLHSPMQTSLPHGSADPRAPGVLCLGPTSWLGCLFLRLGRLIWQHWASSKHGSRRGVGFFMAPRPLGPHSPSQCSFPQDFLLPPDHILPRANKLL